MKRIIGFAGRKRSGKGVLSNHLRSKYNATVITLAQSIKDICCEYLGIPIDELNAEKDRNTLYHINWDDLIKHLSKILNVQYHDIMQLAMRSVDLSDGMLVQNSIRELLQIIGTDIIRELNPNWHVDRMVEEINNCDSDFIAIDDVRFMNEKDVIESLGGTVFFLIRPDLSVDISNHVSEVGLTWTDFKSDRVLINYLTTDLLKNCFDEYLSHNFTLGYDIPILMHGAHQFEGENPYFAFKPTTSDSDSVIIKTLVLPKLSENGTFVIHTSDREVSDWFSNKLTRINNRCVNGYMTVVVWNPYIIENLKAWL